MSKKVFDDLSKEVVLLKKAVKKAKESSADEPEERLSVVNKGNSITFYVNSHGKDIYLPKTEDGQIRRLLQKRYDHAVMREAEAQIKVIERFLKSYQTDALGKAYYDINKMCREMISVYRFPDEEFAKRWQAKVYKGNDYPFGESTYVTAKGERVRSKSEIIIANTLKEAGLPYRYECPLKVMGGLRTIYPDFTILDVSSRSLLYWEHFGKMDNDGYREKAIRKIETYAMEGITPGKGLIITFEDYKTPLSAEVVKEIVERII